MTVSIWRSCHLLLALTSTAFLTLASVTGIILAFEPLESALLPYKPIDLGEVTLSETIEALQTVNDEVLSLELDENGFLLASVVTKTGESKTIYVHPRTGEELGRPKAQAAIFQFATNLHRSLFLKGVGRFFVGVVSFLLCLIALTGLLLIIKRQGGVKKLFSKVQKDYFELRYHVILGRWFLLPILLVAVTGVYLSAEKFSLLPSASAVRHGVEPKTDVDLARKPSELEIFKTIQLSRLRSVNFPFSELPEDYFEISLTDRELYIHQYTGEILSEAPYPFTALAGRFSLAVHTGQGSILWSLVLLVTSISLLFFMYSGFVMWRKRTRHTRSTLPQIDKDEASHIILVGSETGNTLGYAHLFASALHRVGKSAFISELNLFSTYKKAEHLIVLTSTYGEGEAPTNARLFERKFKATQIQGSLKYAVVGFGSLAYPDYCAFAVAIDSLLRKTIGLEEMLPICKIDGQNDQAFRKWAQKWGEKSDTPIEVQFPEKKAKTAKSKRFTVIERTTLNADDTFLIRMRPKRSVDFQSGDLAGIVPEDGIKRRYSIARIESDMLLSVKKHGFGVCSSFLSRLEPGRTVNVHIEKNIGFHFPQNDKPALFIANGTGIAPFLGMLHENDKKVKTHMFLGLRNRKSLGLYEGFLSGMVKNKYLTGIQIAYSRIGKKKYVQDLVKENPGIVSNVLKDGGCILICGSLAMQRHVLRELESIALEKLNAPLSEFEHKGQLRTDCY